MKELLLRTGTGILLIILFVGAILLGPIFMLGILMVVYLLGIRELFGLSKIPLSLSSILLALSGALTITGVYLLFSEKMSSTLFIIPLGIWMIGHALSDKRKTGLLILLWLAMPLALFLALAWFPDGSWRSLLPIAAISLVWVNDTFAYVSGSLLGKHPMTPRLSPGKTWEGFVGGMLFTIIASWLYYYFSGTFTPAVWVLAGISTSVFGIAGDLFESALKRKHKVKDSGKLLPGHGGILDRFDSLLFVAPAWFLLFLLISLFK